MNDDKDTPKWGEDPEPKPKRTSRSRTPREEKPKELPKEWPQARRRRSAKVRYLGQGVYVCNGPSGQRYRFAGHGAVLSVKGEDLDDVLGRTRVNRGCCGRAGVRTQQLFSPA